MVDAGGYARCDFRTATRLLELPETLDERYGAQAAVIGQRFAAYPDLCAAMDAPAGWGPVTVRCSCMSCRVWPGPTRRWRRPC